MFKHHPIPKARKKLKHARHDVFEEHLLKLEGQRKDLGKEDQPHTTKEPEHTNGIPPMETIAGRGRPMRCL